MKWYDRSPAAKWVAGYLGGRTGDVLGIPYGISNTAKTGVETLNFVSRLLDPLDARDSSRGQAAWDKVFNGADAILHGGQEAVTAPLDAIERVRRGFND